MSQQDAHSTEATSSLADITIDPTIQPRLEDVDAAHVAILAEAGAEAWPPLVVVERDGQIVLVDGRHRLEAATQLGLAAIACRVEPLPKDGDLRALAFALNKGHGRPLTPADRKAEAERLLRADGERSDRDLAGRCGIDHKTVGALRKQLETRGEIPQLPTRTGRDEKVRQTKRPRSTSAKSGAPTAIPGAMVAARETAGLAASNPDASMVALLKLVAHIADFLDGHAGDELHVYLADELEPRWPGPERQERAAAMRTLGTQLVAAADRLHSLTTITEQEQEQAA